MLVPATYPGHRERQLRVAYLLLDNVVILASILAPYSLPRSA
jgi:hypothetical protein